MIKVSVIVPVYNTESTLSKMVESLLVQTLKEIEILLIDDGSTDSSGVICDKYANADARVRVIHQKNKGVAMARQTGMDYARGEYTIHADADDWTESKMLEDLYTKAKEDNSDLIVCDYYVNDAKGQHHVMQKPTGVTSIELLHDLFHRLHGSLWNKLIRRTCYIQCNARFIEGINYYEDVLLLTQILSHPEIKISYINKAYYHYSMNGSSITHHITQSTYEGLKKCHQKLDELLPVGDPFFESVKESFAFSPFEAGFRSGLLSKAEIKDEYMKLRKYILKYKSGRQFIGYCLIALGLHKMARKLI